MLFIFYNDTHLNVSSLDLLLFTLLRIWSACLIGEYVFILENSQTFSLRFLYLLNFLSFLKRCLLFISERICTRAHELGKGKSGGERIPSRQADSALSVLSPDLGLEPMNL